MTSPNRFGSPAPQERHNSARLIGTSEPRILPGNPDTLVVSAKANIRTVAVTYLYGLMFPRGKEDVTPMRELVWRVAGFASPFKIASPPNQKLPSTDIHKRDLIS